MNVYCSLAHQLLTENQAYEEKCVNCQINVIQTDVGGVLKQLVTAY